MIDTMLLDAGGVILDESEAERVRAEVAVETLRSRVPGYDLDTYWADVNEAVQSHAPRIYRHVIGKYCGSDAAEFQAVWAAYGARWQEKDPGLTLMAGIDGVLRDLSADFSLVIAGQYGKNLLDLLERNDLLRLFLNTLTQDDFKITKPDPRYYEQILARAGRTAEQSIMVGDRIDKDVVPAKVIGMRTIRVRTGIHINQEPRTADELPDADIPDVMGIPDAARSIASAG